MPDAFGIFEGGGAKGLAHVGALRAAEERRIRFVGLAGTSAGAIVAALAAAGYSSTELFDPDNPGTGRLDIDFTDFFDRDAWLMTKRIRILIAVADTDVSTISWLVRLFWFLLRDFRQLFHLFTRRGVITADRLIVFLDKLLSEKKPNGSGVNGRLLCQDLPTLAVVASDINSQQIQIFSGETTPNIPVSSAVAASLSIPFFFVPAEVSGTQLVDGGLLSNFPAWIFDKERRARGPLVPTYGFRLVETNPRPFRGFVGFFGRLLNMLVSGDPLLETREIENLHVVRLEVSCTTLDFDMLPEKRVEVFREGEKHTTGFFQDHIGNQDPEEMSVILGKYCGEMIEVLRAELATGAGQPHLRASVTMPTTRETLRVMYTYGMDNDADDRLELGLDQGACSRCYKDGVRVLCDMVAAKAGYTKEWKMNKYQQAYVRPQLKSLLCIPIYRPPGRRAKYPHPKGVIGVLSFDSDDDILRAFDKRSVLEVAERASNMIALALTGKKITSGKSA